MADKLITIQIVAGAIQPSMSAVKPKPANNDTLRFKCIDGDFAVFYKNGRNPYTTSGDTVICEQKNVETKKLKIRHLTAAERLKPINDPINGATFEYGVAVLDPATQQILTLDPDIIIDDPGGGGGKTKKKKATAKKKKK